MEYSDLTELLAIWERWTNNDPLLREALQRSATNANRQELEDYLLARLDSLSHDGPGGATTVAALSAGWAVLLALDDAAVLRATTYERLRRDAIEADRDALQHAAHA